MSRSDILAVAKAKAIREIIETDETKDPGYDPCRQDLGEVQAEDMREQLQKNDTASLGLRETASAPQSEQPRLWPEIRMLLEDCLHGNPRDKQREIGPSELGTPCVHCLAAKLAGWPETKSPNWRAFQGTAVHAMFERWFRNLSQTDDRYKDRFETEKRVTVGRLQGIYGGYDVKGSIDLWDKKTYATHDWKDVSKYTLAKAKASIKQAYICQASLYGIGLENEGETVATSAIDFLPHDGLSLDGSYPYEQPFNPEPGRWALRRAQTLIVVMDLIETQYGPEKRDQWISALPKAGRDLCFSCSHCSYPDLQALPEFEDDHRDGLPEEWIPFLDRIPSTFNPTNNQ